MKNNNDEMVYDSLKLSYTFSNFCLIIFIIIDFFKNSVVNSTLLFILSGSLAIFFGAYAIKKSKIEYTTIMKSIVYIILILVTILLCWLLKYKFA